MIEAIGCGPIQHKLTGWHDRHLIDSRTLTAAQAEEVDFGVFGFDPEPPKKGFKATDLAERGQAALANSLGRLSKSPGDLLSAMGTPMKQPGGKPGDEDHSAIDRRIVFSVSHLPVHPGDRIQSLIVRLYPGQKHVKFQAWTQLATKYETIDLGTLTFERDYSASIETTLAPKIAELQGTKPSASTTQKITEAVSLKRTYAALTGRLAPEEMYIFEKAAPGVDLSGIVAVDATIHLPAGIPATITAFDGLFGGDHKPKPGEEVSVATRLITNPIWADDITGCALLTVFVRRVCGGGSSITESDDCARIDLVERPVKVTLSPGIEATIYELQEQTNSVVSAVTAMGHSPLYFADFGAADELRQYLLQRVDRKIGGLQVEMNNGRPVDAPQLRVTAVALNAKAKSEPISCEETIQHPNPHVQKNLETLLNQNRTAEAKKK